MCFYNTIYFIPTVHHSILNQVALECYLKIIYGVRYRHDQAMTVYPETNRCAAGVNRVISEVSVVIKITSSTATTTRHSSRSVNMTSNRDVYQGTLAKKAGILVGKLVLTLTIENVLHGIRRIPGTMIRRQCTSDTVDLSSFMYWYSRISS